MTVGLSGGENDPLFRPLAERGHVHRTSVAVDALPRHPSGRALSSLECHNVGGWTVRTGSRRRVGSWLIAISVMGLVIGTFLPWTRPVERSRSGWQLINDHREHFTVTGLGYEGTGVHTGFLDICGMWTCPESNFYDDTGSLLTGAWALLDAAALIATIVLCTGTPFETRRFRRVPLLKNGRARVVGWVTWGLLLVSTLEALASFKVASDVGKLGAGLALVGASMVMALVGIPMAIPERADHPDRLPRPGHGRPNESSGRRDGSDGTSAPRP